MIMDDYGASWCSVQVFSLCLFCLLTSEAFQAAQPSSLISMMRQGFCRLMPWTLQEPALRVLANRLSRRIFLHLLRGSDLAEDASLQDQWGFFWDSVGCVENIEMRLPRSKICQYDAR